MSVINKMHQQLKHDSEQPPILSSLPAKKSKQKILIVISISLLLFSAIGLLSLIYHKNEYVAVTANIDKQQVLPVSHPQKIAPAVISVESVDIAQVKQEPEVQASTTKLATAIPLVTPEPKPTATVVSPKIEKTIKNNQVVKAKKAPEESLPVAAVQEEKVAHLSITKSVLTESERANIHLKKAERALSKGDSELVAQEKMKALSIKPELHEVRKSIALYYYGIGEQNRATNLLKKGALQFPEYADFSLMLSRIALKNGEQQKAYLYLNQHPPSVEGNLDYHVSYAILAQKFKNYEQAEILYHGLLTQRPNNGRWLMSLAIAQDKQGKEVLAVESYQKALLQIDLSSKAKKYINQRLTYLANQ